MESCVLTNVLKKATIKFQFLISNPACRQVLNLNKISPRGRTYSRPQHFIFFVKNKVLGPPRGTTSSRNFIFINT